MRNCEDVETPELEQARAEINRLNAEYEQLVAERTREIAEINERLKDEIAERRAAEEQLKRSNEELRALSARLHSVRREESLRIAREIHDKLGLVFSSLKWARFGRN